MSFKNIDIFLKILAIIQDKSLILLDIAILLIVFANINESNIALFLMLRGEFIWPYNAINIFLWQTANNSLQSLSTTLWITH